MPEKAEKITLGKLPQAETFGLNISLGIISAGLGALLAIACHALWTDHSYGVAEAVAAVFGLPLLFLLVIVVLMTAQDLKYNRELPGKVAKCRSEPLPGAEYEKFLAVAQKEPAIHGWIAEALSGRDFITRREAEALATRINTYLAQAPQRELTTLVNKSAIQAERT
jgi:hypothetical protein